MCDNQGIEGQGQVYVPAMKRPDLTGEVMKKFQRAADGSGLPPINVELKMMPAPMRPAKAKCPSDTQLPLTGSCCPPENPAFTAQIAKCAKKCPRRCPEGNKAQRTKMILPLVRSYPVSIRTDYRSTYRNDYVPVKGDRHLYHGPPRKPWRSEGPFDGSTVYKTEFRPFAPKPFEKKIWFKEKDYTPPTRPMNVQSSYTRDYGAKKGYPARSTKRKTFLDPNPPLMDDNSTYRTEFLAWCLPEKPLKKTQAEIIAELNEGRIPFDGRTTYQRDYLPVRNHCPAKSTRFNASVKYPMGKFDDKTVYRCAYEPYYFDDVDGFPDCVEGAVYDNMCKQQRSKCGSM